MATAARPAPEPADTSGTDAIVRVEDLRKRYRPGAPEAVAGVSFTIARGEVFGLLGPNGAGKTTTIGALTTRVRPTGGRALVDGIDVERDPVAVKQRIAVVPQRPNLDRALTAIENLTFHGAYFGWTRRERRERARELLARFGLEGRETERVDTYSGGMAQRLMIARALMHDPAVLFLDEPTTGLDPQSRLFLWDQIEEMRARGVTLLLTTHDMSEADRLCDRIAVIDHGQVIALDTPRGLRDLLPGASGLELTLGAANDPTAALAQLGEADGKQLEPGRWQVRVYGDASAGPALAAAERAGADVIDLRRIEGTLEDVFVHLTGRDLR
jgi:ABC-2 type transport system ATP-binding protein